MIALYKNINTPVITSLKTTNSNNNGGNSANAISYVRYNDIIGNKYFELSNHLGNVLVTVSDRKTPQFKTTGTAPNTVTTFSYFKASILSATDYYPFGMAMPGRQVSADKYRYGFNSQEKTTEIAPNTFTAMYWEYDSRIARRWNVDPKPNVSISVYAVFENNPILFNDPLGDTLLNKADQRTANRIEKKINKTNASLNKQATKLNSKIAAADAKGNTAKADRLRGKLADVNARIATNTNTLGNLNKIRNDQTQAYTFNQLPSGSTEGGTMLKTMSVNRINQSVVVMNVLSDAIAVHELTHAVQGAIEKTFIFNLDNAAYPVTFRGATAFAAQQVNANSEVAAYQAQYAFSPGSMLSSTMGGVPGSMNNINAFYVGGLNTTNAAGASVPIYPNVQNMLFRIISTFISTSLKVF
jgi:hypothetical protein